MKKRNESIKVIFSDVDGTLTDGGLYYSSSGSSLKKFHAHDGQGIKMWQQTGRLFGFLSARECKGTRQRGEELRVDYVALGIFDKLSWMKNWLNEHDLGFENLAYIGDDINDLEVMTQARIGAAPSSAVKKIKEKADYICEKKGGEGAVREFIDYFLE